MKALIGLTLLSLTIASYGAQPAQNNDASECSRLTGGAAWGSCIADNPEAREPTKPPTSREQTSNKPDNSKTLDPRSTKQDGE